MVCFNEDIVELILRHCNKWWARDISRLALVSTAWTTSVRKRLFACPLLSTYETCRLLWRTLEENHEYRELVHGLCLRPGCDDAFPSHEDTSSVTRLLAMIRLKNLTLGGDLSIGAERYLRFVGSPQTVESLRIEGTLGQTWLETPKATLEWTSDIPLRFIRLKSLSLIGPLSLDINPDGFSDVVSTEDPAHGCLLENLQLCDVDLYQMSAPIRFLLANPLSWLKLRALSISLRSLDEFQTFNFSSFIPLVSNTLETLVVRSQRESFAHVIALHELIQKANSKLPLQNLHSLDCDNVAVFLEDLYEVIPQIQVLISDDAAYRMHRMDAFFATIAAQRLPSLRYIVLRGSRCSRESIVHDPEALATLAELCGQNNISFKCIT